ncbi:hypothetical protein NBO_80g0025 [Nosema bombycis CQ1]|uniref:T-cell immunomodulatory protein n=1 Tax=Nosema bombycis (strain CQ1 / CVCC 102059) TaxID=578461 RepID=R0KT11_NOSB1|nr:hypothetical protein NBO_80g0025 [Nosema bombycis CQ1]|eukprot:EOB13362.1 hypothetical protein NBO_80g0025 [Nosema bombycis CQ1]
MFIQEETITILNFLLLAYTDLFNSRSYDFVGTTTDPKHLVVKSYNRDTKDFKEIYRYPHKDNIHIVIPANFDGQKNVSLLLVTKISENEYKNAVLFPDNNEVVHLPQTTAAPLLYTQNLSLKPVLLLQISDKLYEFEFSKDKKFTQKKIADLLEKDEKLHKDHTSSMVDLDGDHKSDLVLVVDKKGIKTLKVFKNTENGFSSYFEMALPDTTGPLVFNDFNRNNMNDMAFVSFENGTYYLNLFYNTNKREDPLSYKSGSKDLKLTNLNENIFSNEDKFYLKQNLSSLIKDDLAFKLTCEMLNNVPSGIFDTDIDLDTNIELFLVAKKNNVGDTLIPLRFDPETEQFVIYKEMKFLMDETNVLSFSTADYKNEGRELCVINKVSDGKPQVKIYPNVLKPENMKLSVTTVVDESKTWYGCGVYGTSYLLCYDEGANMSISSSSVPGSFLHLKNQTTTFGLGGHTYQINSLRVTVPSYGDYNKTYVVKYDIIQNLDLIIGVGKHGVYNIRAFVISKIYIAKLLITAAIVLAVHLIINGILQLRHAKKRKEARTRDSMQPLFRSLG